MEATLIAWWNGNQSVSIMDYAFDIYPRPWFAIVLSVNGILLLEGRTDWEIKIE